MSIAFPTATAEIRRTTDLPSNFRMSVLFWAMFTDDPADYATLFDAYTTLGGGFGMQLVLDPFLGSPALSWWDWNAAYVQGSNLSTDTWYHIACVGSSTSVITYLNGEIDINYTVAGYGTQAIDSYIEFGGILATEEFRGYIGPIKIFNASLSQKEVQNEMYQMLPLRQQGLYGAWPTLPGAGERNRDYSGNGRNWTEQNSPGDGIQAPAFWGGGWKMPGIAGGAATVTGTGAGAGSGAGAGAGQHIAVATAAGAGSGAGAGEAAGTTASGAGAGSGSGAGEALAELFATAAGAGSGAGAGAGQHIAVATGAGAGSGAGAGEALAELFATAAGAGSGAGAGAPDGTVLGDGAGTGAGSGAAVATVTTGDPAGGYYAVPADDRLYGVPAGSRLYEVPAD